MSHQELQEILQTLQCSSDNAITLTSEEWEELFKKVVDYFLTTNKGRKAPTTDAGFLKIIDMMTCQFLEGYVEAKTRKWSDVRAAKARFEFIILDSIVTFARHADTQALHSAQSTNNIIARLLSYICANAQFQDQNSSGADASESRERALTAAVMRDQAIQSLAAIVIALSGSVFSSQYLGDPTDTVRLLLQRTLKAVSELTDLLSNLALPAYVIFVNLLPPAISENVTFDPFADDGEHSKICINDSMQLSTHLHDLLQILTQCLSGMSHWSMEPFYREAVVAIARIANLLLSGNPEGFGFKGVAILKSCLVSIRVLGKHHMLTRYREAFCSMTTHILRLRLKTGPRSEWECVDKALLQVLDDSEAYVTSVPVVSGIYEILLKEEWGVEGELLRDCSFAILLGTVNLLDNEATQQYYDGLFQKPRNARLTHLLTALETRLKGSTSTPSANEALHSSSSRSGDQTMWKETIIQSVLPVVCNDDKDRLNSLLADDTRFETWSERAVSSIEGMLCRSIRCGNPPDVADTSKALAAFPCHVVHPQSDSCESSGRSSVLPLLRTTVKCFDALSEASGANQSDVLCRNFLDAVAKCIRHRALDLEDESIITPVLEGMRHEKRTVRLAASRALKEILDLNEYITPTANDRSDSVFNKVTEILNGACDPVKETTVVFLGLAGKSQSAFLVEKCVFVLVTQLGQANALLRSTAFTQLITLSKYHGRTVYSLALPNLGRIALFLLSSVDQHPSMLNETCRLFMTTPASLLSSTLTQTLPTLFATCDDKSLCRLEKALGRRTPDVFSDYVAEVLVEIFLLGDEERTHSALQFLQDHINSRTDDSFKVTSALKDYLWKVLAELIISMGKETPEEIQRAVAAVKKVQVTLKTDPSYQHLDPDHCGGILVENLLGIVTHLNEMVQNTRQTDTTRNRVLRGLGLMILEVGTQIVTVAPQIMATLQTTVRVRNLSEATLSAWKAFVISLDIADLGTIVGQTSAAIVDAWPCLSTTGRRYGKDSLEYIVLQRGVELGESLDALIDLSNVPELFNCSERLRMLRQHETAKAKLDHVIQRFFTDNVTVIAQSLEELRKFMVDTDGAFIRDLTSGDVFDPIVGSLVKALLSVACRGGDERAHLRSLAFECIGILGAIDPDRFDIPHHESSNVVMDDFADESESLLFAMQLIEDVLIGAYRSTSDIKYQSEIAFAIQELLKVCGFTIDLVTPGGVPVPLKVRARWNKLPKHVLDTVTPLLASKFALPSEQDYVAKHHPIYHVSASYRDWIQHWTGHLISKASGVMARKIFKVFKAVVHSNDVGVTQQILPHLALNVLMSGSDEDVTNMRAEITAVLEDQLNSGSDSTLDKKRSSAQLIFTLMDHFNKWLYFARLEIAIRRQEAGPAASSRRSRQPQTTIDLQVLRVESILASIDQNLLARAAFECNSYARSLMNYEKHVMMLQGAGVSSNRLQDCYERLHEIYAHLDEPDGMEGVSTFTMIPSLEHHIRQHESKGRWTSAQSCWEIRLQQSPDNLDYHVGLLRCLRNLGHYDSLRTHIQGVLVRNPMWEDSLSGFRVEGALMANDWAAVQSIVSESRSKSSEVSIARVLLSIRSGDEGAISKALSVARAQMGDPITTAGERGYRRAYDAILSLHVLQDIETIHRSTSRKGGTQVVLANLSNVLKTRLEATLPTFRAREPILNMHRTAFSLSSNILPSLKRDIGRAWLSSAKIARKAGQWQTAYSAVLQARECNAPMSFIQSAKLVKTTGEPLRALYELDVALQGMAAERYENIALSQSEVEQKVRMLAKAKLLRARWMRESERFDSGVVLKELTDLAKMHSDMESAYFHAGHFQDELYTNLSRPDKKTRGQIMVIFTVKQYARSLRFGSKYTYQTIPRLLTLWLDMGEDNTLSSSDTFAQVNKEIDSAIKHTPIYKWLTAFPQIVSRVDHRNNQAYSILSKLILTVMQEYPLQSLWLFMSVVKSTKPRRERRGTGILDQLKNHPHNSTTNVPSLVQQAVSMATELLRLCDAPIKDNDAKTLSMTRDFPLLKRQAPSDLIIPLQESLTVNLPATSCQNSDHQPFPPDAPKFYQFLDEVDVMKSLAKPRKITIVGTNSEHYIFLGKPKDDLRKDARLMDFNAIINKLLRSNSDSRRRRLRIRTYSVVTLNEECGFIQWVPNTTPIRAILMKYYSGKGIDSWNREMSLIFQKIKESSDKDAGKIFKDEILKLFPGVFHQWFLDQFPEPTAWLSSRLAYGRTAAVMSMVGFILGLGDRHLENILLDVNTGDVVHVDFNCLFERGKTLDTPERVPFRLTQNLVDGLGVTGVEGVFRTACEISMQLLRANKDVLMNVLDAFIHDPLVEWEDEKRKRERHARNGVREPIDPRRFAKEALERIKQKLQGMYVKDNNPNERRDKEIATNNLVQLLIEEATDLRNLAKMYPGWAPWH